MTCQLAGLRAALAEQFGYPRQHRLEVGPRGCGRADVEAGCLGHVPAVLEDLVEDLGPRETAAQVFGDRSDYRIVDIAQPLAGRHNLGHRAAALLLQVGPEAGDVVEQPAGLILLHDEAGAQEQLARVMPGLRHPGPQPEPVPVRRADQLHLVGVEAELVEPAQPLRDPVALVVRVQQLFPGQLVPETFVPPGQLRGDLQRVQVSG